jgi:diaminopimelate epimerase
MALHFVKYHGLGNDFVVVESDVLMSREEAVALCDRHRGVGGDGVLSILPSRRPEARRRMHLYNADGSEAEMCGNGLRCVVRHALGATSVDEHIVFDTDAGLRWGHTRPGGGVRVGLGQPEILQDRLALTVDGRVFRGTWVSMGNPHFVLDASTATSAEVQADAARWGAVLEHHDAFPARSNVEWVRRREDGAVDVVVWERGAGLTQACGTGAGATLAALRARGEVTGDAVVVWLPGGPLAVSRDPSTHEVAIEGEAVRVFAGQW